MSDKQHNSPSLKVNQVTMFKHGVASFTLRGEVDDTTTLALEFKKDEMNDVLKSLLVLDQGGGYVSSIAYDADQDIGKLLEDVAVDLASKDSFTSLLENFRGATVDLSVGGDTTVTGKVMGIQEYVMVHQQSPVKRPALVILGADDKIQQVQFSDVKTFKLRDPKLQRDLEFYLNTIIAGKKTDAKRIFIHCEGEGHREIATSYIIESPVWKTSYRLIIPETLEAPKEASPESGDGAQAGDETGDKDDQCFLSGWCLVENTTTQDWEGVKLTLVAGMPVSFVCPIYPPIYMERPVVEPPKVAQIGPAQIEDEAEEMAYEKMAKRKGERKRARRPPAMKALASMDVAAGMGPPGAPPSAPPPAPSPTQAYRAQAQQQTQVSTKDMGELFQYEISNPVTIKRKKSALVPIVSTDIESKPLLLYEASQHPKNPMACLEVKNTTGVTLEQGPVTIFFEENLAGEAMLPFLNQEETRILSYALEQGVVVDHETKSRTLHVHRVQFSGGYSYEYYYSLKHTNYKVRNKTERRHQLLVDHPKTADYDLYDTDLEKRDTPQFHRFVFTLESKQNITFDVNERKENYSSVHIWNMSKKDLLAKVQNYVDHDWIAPADGTILKEVADLLASLQETRETLGKRREEREQIFSDQARLRQNIESMGTSRSETELREKYVRKLDAQESRLETIENEIQRLQEEETSLSEQISDKLESLEHPEEA